MRANPTQLLIDHLIDHMNDNPEFARASRVAHHDQDWEDLTVALNLLGNDRTKQQWIRVSYTTFTVYRKHTCLYYM